MKIQFRKICGMMLKQCLERKQTQKKFQMIKVSTSCNWKKGNKITQSKDEEINNKVKTRN